jgi:hypothetical protein
VTTVTAGDGDPRYRVAADACSSAARRLAGVSDGGGVPKGATVTHRRFLYAWVAGTWGVVFGVVGCVFLLAPGKTGESLTALAAAFGLAGEIRTTCGDLWWALAVSLMATITVLALASAGDPRERSLFVALLTAKLTSTAMFVVLAAAQGGAWALCAAADGLVAASLVAARAGERSGP